MAQYMVQSMQSGTKAKVTYYRKQSSSHPGHAETGRFTQAAIKKYAETYSVEEDTIEKGKYMSGQGVPADGEEI